MIVNWQSQECNEIAAQDDVQEQAPGAGVSFKHRIGTLNYMKKMPQFYGNEPPPGSKQRSWQEWVGEFAQNGRLCGLKEELYYDMAEALLSNNMREVWQRYLQVRPEDGTWAGMKSYMSVHYAALDKSAEAKEKFEKLKLQESTEKSWQEYCNAQAAHIADMGPVAKRKLTDSGLWDMFLANISMPEVHTTAFQAYMHSMEEYDLLPVQARITKLTPVLLTYLKSKAASTASHSGAGGAGAGGTAIGEGGNGHTGGIGVQQETKRHAESSGGHQTQRLKMMEPMAPGRTQPEGKTIYGAVPTDVNHLQCPDVGFLSEHESKPYNHSLNRLLRESGKCLVCWSNSHRIGDCPHKSQGMKDDEEAKKQTHRNAGGFTGGFTRGRGGSSFKSTRGWRGRH